MVCSISDLKYRLVFEAFSQVKELPLLISLWMELGYCGIPITLLINHRNLTWSIPLTHTLRYLCCKMKYQLLMQLMYDILQVIHLTISIPSLAAPHSGLYLGPATSFDCNLLYFIKKHKNKIKYKTQHRKTKMNNSE